MESLIAKVEAAYRRKNIPDFRVGDVVRVHQRIREGGKERIQVFEGLVIAKKHGSGMNGTFTVRRIASGVGVERIYPLHTPAIAKVERVRSASVRKAKLYYLRERIGKKARLKTIDAYAAWEEPSAEELAAAEAEAATPTETDETQPAGEAVVAEAVGEAASTAAEAETIPQAEPSEPVVEVQESEEAPAVAEESASEAAETPEAKTADEASEVKEVQV